MHLRDRPRPASWIFAVTLVLCLAIAVVVVARAVTHAGGLRSDAVESIAVPLLAIALAGTLAALWGWWHDARAARRLLEAERRGGPDAERELGDSAQAIEAARSEASAAKERDDAEGSYLPALD